MSDTDLLRSKNLIVEFRGKNSGFVGN
uniref:Uncharacterized protein n=1 Tax=Rhizophora mucronata TaxID=61149 RepID=A0A2P2PT78_RHIMU